LSDFVVSTRLVGDEEATCEHVWIVLSRDLVMTILSAVALLPSCWEDGGLMLAIIVRVGRTDC
jgi:hypothetical protein